MTIWASSPGSIRAPSSGAMTHGTPAQSTPGVCPLAATSRGSPSSGPARGGEQVRPGDDGAHERVLLEREEFQAAVGAGGEAAEQFVCLRQGGRVRDRAGQMIGGVVHLTAFERRAGLLEVAVGGVPGIIHDHAFPAWHAVCHRREPRRRISICQAANCTHPCSKRCDWRLYSARLRTK
nr:hypothetical protein GCM10020092_013780 [Actinoplanes digitatis]